MCSLYCFCHVGIILVLFARVSGFEIFNESFVRNCFCDVYFIRRFMIIYEMYWNKLSNRISNILTVLIGYWLNLILLTWRIGWAPNNARKWQVGFNSAFKGLKLIFSLQLNDFLSVFLYRLMLKSWPAEIPLFYTPLYMWLIIINNNIF